MARVYGTATTYTIGKLHDRFSVSGWGDSITYGTAASSGNDFLSVIQRYTGVPTNNHGVGSQTSQQILARVQAHPSHDREFALFWLGHNNAYNATAQVLSDIADCVTAIGHQNYLVISRLNNTSMPIGSAELTAILAFNATLSSTYGEKYVDIRAELLAAYNPLSATDVADVATGIFPTSLRYDYIHPNDAGHQVIGRVLSERIPARWIT